MPLIHINDKPIEAAAGQTVMQVAVANGIYIPYFCWHPALSNAGNCRICMVEVEGSGLDISCNMPVWEGMKVYTESEAVKEQRKLIMQMITLNHPVDCGICDKAGECTLQDYHFAYNGEASVSHEPKVRSTKFHDLSSRIVLDNERCIVCSRCVRFTREISKSNSLGIVNRADHSMIRAAEDKPLENDPYSDNIVDLCPVGALLSRDFMYKARVWYLKPTPSVCPGCERGCAINIWHRKPEWQLRGLEARKNTCIERITPLENPAVNGPWICNKGRDLARTFERPRALEPMQKGKVVTQAEAEKAAAALIKAARRPVALVSSWGSDEELAAFADHLAARFDCRVKPDCRPEPDEILEDELLIRADKNPNGHTAKARFGDRGPELPADADLVLVWGEGRDFSTLPPQARIVFLNAWLAPENGHADVFIPTTIQTERNGHYTNFAGVTSAFEACFPRAGNAVDAEAVFGRIGAALGGAP
ncbi:MAG: (2Fe-2S)-binding protein [Steroidobacteraceae bacterium]|nr:(2Fe-2S)-binding protein [Steroidobacteraceae bacterium]MCC7198392.1 (2Fe-2S)-binding protein [Gammaproteobacteria bacterium]